MTEKEEVHIPDHAAEIGVLSIRRLMHDSELACRICGRGLYEHESFKWQWVEK